MNTLKEPISNELKFLFNALCDGIRQEVRYHCIASLVHDKDFSITQERGEQGIIPFLAAHLRMTGFFVQTEAYFPGNAKIRPDLGIWLPNNKQFIYIEVKMTAWGGDEQYSYQPVIKDIEKLNGLSSSEDLLKGVLAFGFSKPDEQTDWLENKYRDYLSKAIAEQYPYYEEIGLEPVDLQEMDKQTSYAMIGLWVRRVKKTEDK